MNKINDYIPFMDLHPELNLKPTSDFPQIEGISKFDYIQDLNLRENNSTQGCFYLIIKDGKYGIFMYDPGFFFDAYAIALKPVYEEIYIYQHEGRHFRAIVKKEGKYGIVFWTYGFFNKLEEVEPVYDAIERINESRFKAIKDNNVFYLDSTGKMLK